MPKLAQATPNDFVTVLQASSVGSLANAQLLYRPVDMVVAVPYTSNASGVLTIPTVRAPIAYIGKPCGMNRPLMREYLNCFGP
jgi:hypothetical protein